MKTRRRSVSTLLICVIVLTIGLAVTATPALTTTEQAASGAGLSQKTRLSSRDKRRVERQVRSTVLGLKKGAGLARLRLDERNQVSVFHNTTLTTLPDHSNAIICAGTSPIPFAKCVNTWLVSNAGQCVRVWIEHDGTYCASDNCPE